MNGQKNDQLISFVIVTYNSEAFIDACLKSIQKEMTSYHYEVIIVDNASSQPLPDLEGRYPNVTLIRNRLNLGFAVANNMGIQAAKGDILWLLNPDTLLIEGCAGPALSGFNHPEVGIIGNQLINPDGSLQKSVFENVSVVNELLKAMALPGLATYVIRHFPRLKQRIRNMKGLGRNLHDLTDSVGVPMVIGASMIVRRAMVKEIGLFDARYFMYLEEADLCFRAHKYGWAVLYCPESKVIHYGGHATWNAAGKVYIEQFKSLLLFLTLYYPKRHVFACRAALVFAAIMRILMIPTPFYKLDLGMGSYQAGQRTIQFSRKSALVSYMKLITIAFTPVPRKI
jgi:GT2 family glycosyltransferase